MNVTEKITEFILNTSFEDFPSEVVEKSKLAFLDWIGVTLAGRTEEVGKIILEFVKKEGGREQASIIGTDMKTSCTNAALAMGTLSHALDFDDLSYAMRGHPSTTIFPALFTLGEINSIDGKKSIEITIARIY